MKTEITVGPESSLQDILDMLPPGATVKLKPGIYRQKLQIRTPGLTLIGAGAEETRLVYDDYARKLHPDGREYNTFRTWTVAVCADGVSMRDLPQGEGPGGGPQRLWGRFFDGGLPPPLHPGHALCGSPAPGPDPALCGPAAPGAAGGQALRQGSVVKAHILDALGKGQVHTPEALFPRGGGPGLQGLQRLRHRGVYIVQTDS